MTDNNKKDTKKRKISYDELYELLNLDHSYEEERKKLDANAIIRVVRQKPWLATNRYIFSSPVHRKRRCFPLLKAIVLRAPVEVIDALCSTEALSGTKRVLHYALQNCASFDVIALLLKKRPKAVKEKDDYETTPLYIACMNSSSSKIVSLLLDHWPGGIKEKNFHRDSPLHGACRNGVPLEVMSILLDRWPEATKEKNINGNTPLHVACYNGAELGVILLLLDAYPEAIQQTTTNGKTPTDIAQGFHPAEDVQKVLSYVSKLFDDDELSKDALEEIMSFVIRIEWWKGFWLVFKRHPTVTQTIDLDTNVKADFLSMVGRYCKLTSMWEVIRNEQDLLADA